MYEIFERTQNANYEVKEDEMSEACSTHWIDEKCVHNFGR